MIKGFHSGDLGDIVAALPAINALNIDTLLLTRDVRTRELMCESRAANIGSLLEMNGINWDFAGRGEGLDLNRFRKRYPIYRGLKYNLAEMQLVDWKLDIELCRRPWLCNPGTEYRNYVIFCRSERYNSTGFPWSTVLSRTNLFESFFIGTDVEYYRFCQAVGEIPRIHCKNLAEVCGAIAGANLVVCNQSCPMWIAEGLGKRYLLDVWDQDANCMFYRDGVYHNLDNLEV